MKRRARFVGSAFAALVFSTACNAILGIGDLSAPDPMVAADGSSESASDAPFIDSPLEEAGDAGCDPCAVVEPQAGASIYPTWLITSDLPIQNVNVSVVNPRTPSYEDAGAGTVREETSGLTWQTAYAAGGAAVDYTGAVSACAALGAGWRVPTRIEIATTQYRDGALTADSGTRTSCVPPVFATATDYVWTSTTVAGAEAGVEVYFHDERGCGFLGSATSATFNVRCVKGDTKPATFNVSVKEDLVHAVDTHLDWERTGTIVQTYAEAKAHCDSKGWRVPIIQELYGILDTRTPTLTDTRLFVPAGTVPRAIVSQTVSTVAADGTPSRGVVSMLEGSRGHEDEMQLDDGIRDILVRCVRQHVP